MESQLPPPPASAILAPPSQHHQPQPQYYHRLSSPAANCDYDYDSQYSEKEHRHHSSVHSDRLSRSSNRRPHDSVISHPFSPKPSSPPSPSTNSSSSISSVGHHRNSSNAHRYSSSQLERQSLSFPPQAHIDPEKHAEALAHGYRVSNRLSAVPSGADAIVYDKGAYQEKGAEEKAWQLLVRRKIPMSHPTRRARD